MQLKIPDWKLLLNKFGKKGIVSNIPFIMYLALLALIHIAIVHQTQNTIKDINNAAKEIKELRWKYIDEKTQIMYLTKESELETNAASLGLFKTKVPPYKIVLKNN